MPKFVAIGYGDRSGYDRTPKLLRDDAHAQDEALKSAGAVIGVAGSPILVRNTENTGIIVESAAFMSSALPIAGITVVDAASIEEAIELLSKTPCAIAHGVVEIWPLS